MSTFRDFLARLNPRALPNGEWQGPTRPPSSPWPPPHVIPPGDEPEWRAFLEYNTVHRYSRMTYDNLVTNNELRLAQLTAWSDFVPYPHLKFAYCDTETQRELSRKLMVAWSFYWKFFPGNPEYFRVRRAMHDKGR